MEKTVVKKYENVLPLKLFNVLSVEAKHIENKEEISYFYKYPFAEPQTAVEVSYIYR